jgi:type I restriction enzyme, R subunit
LQAADRAGQASDRIRCAELHLPTSTFDIELHEHNLFQAICRTNRLDGDDKDYGYIGDFKELFQDVPNSIAVCSSDKLDIDADGKDGNVIVKDWLVEGRAQLEAAREALRYLCEPVAQPREVEQYLYYFCGNASNASALAETEPLRVSFYKAAATFLRAYADIAKILPRPDINLNALSLTELIIETGIHDAIARKLNEKGKLSKNAIAEGIINNVRKTIIRDQLTDPRFYAEMSKLLDDLIKQSRASPLSRLSGSRAAQPSRPARFQSSAPPHTKKKLCACRSCSDTWSNVRTSFPCAITVLAPT